MTTSNCGSDEVKKFRMEQPRRDRAICREIRGFFNFFEVQPGALKRNNKFRRPLDYRSPCSLLATRRRSLHPRFDCTEHCCCQQPSAAHRTSPVAPGACVYVFGFVPVRAESGAAAGPPAWSDADKNEQTSSFPPPECPVESDRSEPKQPSSGPGSLGDLTAPGGLTSFLSVVDLTISSRSVGGGSGKGISLSKGQSLGTPNPLLPASSVDFPTFSQMAAIRRSPSAADRVGFDVQLGVFGGWLTWRGFGGSFQNLSAWVLL